MSSYLPDFLLTAHPTNKERKLVNSTKCIVMGPHYEPVSLPISKSYSYPLRFFILFFLSNIYVIKPNSGSSLLVFRKIANYVRGCLA